MTGKVVTNVFHVYDEITTNETLMRRATLATACTRILSLLGSEGITACSSSLTAIPPTCQIKRYICIKCSQNKRS